MLCQQQVISLTTESICVFLVFLTVEHLAGPADLFEHEVDDSFEPAGRDLPSQWVSLIRPYRLDSLCNCTL